jgi:hypothetical protein
MNKKEIIKKIEKEKEKIKKNGVKKIGIFGSFAKNKQTPKSDIDILVSFNSPDFDKYAQTLIILEKLLKRKVDLVIEKNLRKELNYVKKEAIYVKI